MIKKCSDFNRRVPTITKTRLQFKSSLLHFRSRWRRWRLMCWRAGRSATRMSICLNPSRIRSRLKFASKRSTTRCSKPTTRWCSDIGRATRSSYRTVWVMLRLTCNSPSRALTRTSRTSGALTRPWRLSSRRTTRSMFETKWELYLKII